MKVSRLSVAPVADTGHQVDSTEATTHSIVDTFWLPPVLLSNTDTSVSQTRKTRNALSNLQFVVSVRLVAYEALAALLDDLVLVDRLNHHD